MASLLVALALLQGHALDTFRSNIGEWADYTGSVSTANPLTLDLLLCDGNLPFKVL